VFDGRINSVDGAAAAAVRPTAVVDRRRLRITPCLPAPTYGPTHAASRTVATGAKAAAAAAAARALCDVSYTSSDVQNDEP